MSDLCLCGHDLSDHDAHDACGVWGCECILFTADGWPPDPDEGRPDEYERGPR